MRFAVSSLLLGLFLLPTLLVSQTNTDSAAAMTDTTRVGPRPGEALAPSMTQWLTGRFPGVLVYPSSGTVGTGARIRIRGSASLVLSNEPALYVDGVRAEGHERGLTFGSNGEWTSSAAGRLTSRLNDLSPEDVDSIVIVRGPAAGVMYGPELATGAILVYTRRGGAGPARWRAYAEEGRAWDVAGWPTNYGGVDLDHADSLYRRGRCSLQAEVAGRCTQDFVRTFESLVAREQFRTAPHRQYGLGVSGKQGRIQYAVGGAIESEGGVYELTASEVDRLVAAAGPDAASDDVIHPSRFRGSRFYGNFGMPLGPDADVGVTIFRRRIDTRLPPVTDFMARGLTGASEPAATMSWSGSRPGDVFQRVAFHEVERLGGGVRLSWRPAPSLEVTGLAGFDDIEQRDHPRSQPYQRIDHHVGVERQTYQLGANLAFGLPGALSGRARLSVQRLDYALDAYMIEAFWTPDSSAWSTEELWLYPEHGATTIAVEQEVNWRDRVILAAGVRHSGLEGMTTGLDGGYVVGPFPPSPAPRRSGSGSLWHPALRLSWVPMAGPRGLVDRVNLRLGYGTAGRRLGRLTTERTAELEFGAEATFLRGRAGVAAQAYSRVTSDAGVMVPVGSYVGYSGTTVAAGAGTSNRGIEVSVTAVPVRGTDWSWDVTLGAWGNRNRLTTLPAPPSGSLREGYPVPGYWGRPILGYADGNADGIIEASEVTLGESWEWLGSASPTQGATLATGLALWNRLRIGGLLEYRAGHVLVNETAAGRCRVWVCREMNDRTAPLDRQAAAVAAYSTPAGYVDDADYLKLRELSLTVTAPASLARAVRAQSLRLTLAGRNLATWTGYTGFDPEVNSDAQDGEFPYRDRFAQPPVRYWTLRLDMAF